jgi:hypothetical protein
MPIHKMFFAALSLLLFWGNLSAQNTNSPYSRYGFGTLENQIMGKSRAMGGIGYGLRENGIINPLNPASYSAVDTMNLLFDFGLSASYYNFKEDGSSQGDLNAGLDYLGMKIALKPNWGLALGLMPYSKVGYSFGDSYTTRDMDNKKITYDKSYGGSGGLNTLFLGSSAMLGDNLSLGFNFKYIFGEIAHYTSISSTYSGFSSQYFSQNWYLNALSLDLGAQYEIKFGKKRKVIIGAVFTRKSSFIRRSVYEFTIANDTTDNTKKYTFGLPNTLGVGFTYTYDNRLTVGMDYQMQAWSKSSYFNKKDSLSDNTKISFGLEYLPSLITTNYFQAIKYRFGMQYADSYIKFPDGSIKSVGVTLGFGLPLKGQRSSLNVSFEAGKLIVPNSSYISENYYKLALDVAFNELWFFKRKL